MFQVVDEYCIQSVALLSANIMIKANNKPFHYGYHNDIR